MAHVANSGPHSQRTLLQPFFESSLSNLEGSFELNLNLSGPTGSSEKNASFASGPYAIKVLAILVSQSFAERGKSKVLEKTTLKGSIFDFPLEVNKGLSDLTVPPPTITASQFALIL